MGADFSNENKVRMLGTNLPIRYNLVSITTHRGARTHDHQVKSLTLCRLS